MWRSPEPTGSAPPEQRPTSMRLAQTGKSAKDRAAVPSKMPADTGSGADSKLPGTTRTFQVGAVSPFMPISRPSGRRLAGDRSGSGRCVTCIRRADSASENPARTGKPGNSPGMRRCTRTVVRLASSPCPADQARIEACPVCRDARAALRLARNPYRITPPRKAQAAAPLPHGKVPACARGRACDDASGACARSKPHRAARPGAPARPAPVR
jgi:hypothetical protein